MRDEPRGYSQHPPYNSPPYGRPMSELPRGYGQPPHYNPPPYGAPHNAPNARMNPRMADMARRQEAQRRLALEAAQRRGGSSYMFDQNPRRGGPSFMSDPRQQRRGGPSSMFDASSRRMVGYGQTQGGPGFGQAQGGPGFNQVQGGPGFGQAQGLPGVDELEQEIKMMVSESFYQFYNFRFKNLFLVQ